MAHPWFPDNLVHSTASVDPIKPPSSNRIPSSCRFVLNLWLFTFLGQVVVK